MSLLSVESLDVFYGNVQAVWDVSFGVEAGEILTLVGANGAGKTTLLRTIAGAIRPRAGTVAFLSEDITGLRPDRIVRKGIALVPEGRAILSRMTVLENLEMGAYHRKDDRIAADVEAVMDRFPILRSRRGQPGGLLSGGEQQMLAIARALMARPKLLLLDEPSLGLAPLVVSEIFRIVREINREGTTVLLVEQNVKLSLRISDSACVLETGKIALRGDSKSLLEEPRIKESYLGRG